MIVINTVSDKRFSLNGIEYVKNFLSFVAGDRLLIYNAYDRTDERCDLTLYSEFQINGVTYASAALVQAALINVIYTRSSLGGAIISRFDELLDTFGYTGRNTHFVRVNSNATGLESVSSNIFSDSEKAKLALLDPNNTPTTTAGIINRIFFTGVQLTLPGGTFFTSSILGKGAVATASPTPLVNTDNQKQFFNKDIISTAQTQSSISPLGAYSISLSVRNNIDVAQQKYTVEIYKANNNGVAINSGVSGAVVGDLGVTLVTTLSSGLINLVADNLTNIILTGELLAPLSLAVGERLRYHVSAEKVGTAGGSITMEVFYGSDHNSYFDIPVTFDSDDILNRSDVLGITVTDALNTLNAGTGGGADNTDYLPEGTTNLYFTTARVLSTLLTGISFATGGAIVSTDSILMAFGKIQKQINNILTSIGLKQDTLVSGTNIKTINGSSILGSGNLSVVGSVTTTTKTITSANLTTQDVTGFLTYVNEVTSFTIGAAEIVKYSVTDTGQIFEIKSTGISRNIGSGQTALTSGEILLLELDFMKDFGTFSFDSFVMANGSGSYVNQHSAITSTTGTLTTSSVGGSNWTGKRRLCNCYFSAAAAGSFSQVLSSAPSMAVGNSNTVIEGFCASEHATPVATSRSFSGIKYIITSIGNVDPSTLTQILGIGNDSADTNLQIMHNDNTGTATKIDLGSSFPARYNKGDHIYRWEAHSFIGSSIFLIKVECVVTGVKTSRLLTTNTPLLGSQMYPFCWMNNGTTAAEVRMLFFSWIFKNY